MEVKSQEPQINTETMFELLVAMGIDASLRQAESLSKNLSAAERSAILAASNEAEKHALVQSAIDRKDWSLRAFDWSPAEALAQMRAALPDIGYCERYGFSREQFQRLNEMVERTEAGPVPDEELLPVLKEVFDMLPAAWKEHGGVPYAVKESASRTIRRIEGGQQNDNVCEPS